MRSYSKNGAMETVITISFKNILTFFLMKACSSLLSEDGDGCNNDETIVKNRKVFLKKTVPGKIEKSLTRELASNSTTSKQADLAKILCPKEVIVRIERL